MRCDDFICLGRTVPEESKKYGAKVCMAGISQELGSLMRVYPLPVVNPIKARHECRLELERNHQDSRRESWKLRDRFESVLSVSDRPTLTNDRIAAVLKPHLARSIDELNDRRLSLGVLEMCGGAAGFFRERSGVNHPDQGTLFDVADECFGAGAIDLAPYIGFWDADGNRHDLQIREWGCYEWIRNHRPEASKLWDNLRIGDGTTWAVVGNQANRRTSWLIIKTFTIPTTTQAELFGAA
jgi:hypothetical protein